MSRVIAGIVLILGLAGCPTLPLELPSDLPGSPGDKPIVVPEGYVRMPVSRQLLTQDEACARALFIRATARVTFAFLSESERLARVQAEMRPFADILQAPYCRDRAAVE